MVTVESILITLAVATLPVIELRGAIPVGLAHGLSYWLALVVSILGNMVPVPFIILFFRKLLFWLRGRFTPLDRLIEKLEWRVRTKAAKIRRYELLGLFIFVAVPLPGTGAWTASAIAAFLGLRLKVSVPVIFLGVLTAGLIITALSYSAVLAFGG